MPTKSISARPKPLSLTLTLIVATIILGLAIRFAPLNLPPTVTKYGGSTLWALMIYWIVSALVPNKPPSVAALLAGALATAVELFKLYNPPAVDAFRHTLPGILLLGRFFSAWDIAAYWIAILAGAILDASLRRNLQNR